MCKNVLTKDKKTCYTVCNRVRQNRNTKSKGEIEMKKPYLVSFRYSEKVHCTNIVFTDDTAKIAEKYGNKYAWHTFRECAEWEVETYKKRGMPIFEL